jgi:hypothetical protein
MKLTDQVQDTVTRESKNRTNLEATIRTIDRLRAAGLIGTPSYRFPPPDTIGRHLYDAPDISAKSTVRSS